MLISSSRQMPPIDAMRNARQFAPRVKQTPPKCQPTHEVEDRIAEDVHAPSGLKKSMPMNWATYHCSLPEPNCCIPHIEAGG